MKMEFLHHIGLLIISFFSNFISSISGGGAGIIQLPALILFGIPFGSALATHKVASVALGLGATFRHAREKKLTLKFIILILFSGLPGVLLGAYLALSTSNYLGSISLGILTLSISIYSISTRNYSYKQEYDITFNYRNIIGCLGIFIIAFLNGFLSSGTGLLVTIWLVRWFKFSYAEAIKYTLILVGFFWNLIGALVLGFSGNIYWDILPLLIVGSFSGGFVGAHFSIIKSEKVLKRFFEFTSLIVALMLIIKGVNYS